MYDSAGVEHDPYAAPTEPTPSAAASRAPAQKVAIALVVAATLFSAATSSARRVLPYLVLRRDGAVGDGFTWGAVAGLAAGGIIALLGERRTFAAAAALATLTAALVAITNDAGSGSIATLIFASTIGTSAIAVFAANVVPRRRTLRVLFGVGLSSAIATRVVTPAAENALELEGQTIAKLAAAFAMLAAVLAAALTLAAPRAAQQRDDRSTWGEYARGTVGVLAVFVPCWVVRTAASMQLREAISRAMASSAPEGDLGGAIARSMMPSRYLELATSLGTGAAFLVGLIAVTAYEARLRARHAVAVALGVVAAAAVATIFTKASLAWPVVLTATMSAGTMFTLPFMQMRLYTGVRPSHAGAAVFVVGASVLVTDVIVHRAVDATSSSVVLAAGAVAAALVGGALFFRARPGE